MRYVFKSSVFLLLFSQVFVSPSANTLSDPPNRDITHLERSECTYSCANDSTYSATNLSVESLLSFHSTKASVDDRQFVEQILMDGFIGEMRLDAKKIATDSLRPLNINTDMETGNVSGYFFNFFDHKPTFKLHTVEQRKVTLAGGPLTAPYIMDQFHFHVYCTRKEAAENTLDGAQVPIELHLVFFHEKYRFYSNALFRYKDGLAVVAIYLEAGEEGSSNSQIENFSSLVDHISQDENRKLSATASIKQLTEPLHETNVRYNAYRGDLVEPFKCKNCVDVFVMKERLSVSVNQMTEFRKAPHCVENDWGF